MIHKHFILDAWKDVFFKKKYFKRKVLFWGIVCTKMCMSLEGCCLRSDKEGQKRE